MSSKPSDIQTLDDPNTTAKRSQTLKENKFLYKLYLDWYNFFFSHIEDLPPGIRVELGSGGGFLKELDSDIITSDVMQLDCVDKVFSAEEMPFENDSLSGIFMIDVLHHIPNCRNFFKEANRTLKKDGLIIMSEPANTPWSRFFYQNFHHEPFDPKAGWEIEFSSGPLSGANGAIPWIVFNRDRVLFEKEFPQLKIKEVTLHTPFRYLLSGGMSYNAFLPHWSYGAVKWIEKISRPLFPLFAMFQVIVIKKK